MTYIVSSGMLNPSIPYHTILTLKVVSESRVTWATYVPILVFLCSRVIPDVCDRRQTKASLNASALTGRGIINVACTTTSYTHAIFAISFHSHNPSLLHDAMRKHGLWCHPVSIRPSRWIVSRRLTISSNFFPIPVAP